MNYAIARFKGEECMDYKEFIERTFENTPNEQPSSTRKKTAGEILAEFGPLVDADRMRGGANG